MKKSACIVLFLTVGLILVSGGNLGFALTRHSQKVQQPTSSKPGNGAAQAVQKIAGSIPVNLRGVFVDGLPNILGQMVTAGDNVDVVFTFEATLKSGNKEKVSVTLLQHVKVLAAGVEAVSGAVRQPEKSGYVVLALTPRDAQYLALARAEGVIEVIVRAPADTTNYIMEMATFGKLFQ